MIKAYFDGACEPNCDGGRMTYGGVIYEHDIKIYEISNRFKRADNIASNNIAEYVALIAVLKYLIHIKKTKAEIYIFGDSKLVIEQMNGNWAIRKGKYIEYAELASEKLMFFDECILEWIPREQNKEADELSRRAL